jgi:folate-binding protein YgfZ
MDDFKPVDMAGTHETILFYGEYSEDFAKGIFGIDVKSFSNNDFSIHVENDRHSMIARNDDSFGGFYFIYAAKDNNYWSEKVFTDENFNRYSMTEISSDEFEAKRIELGIPAYGKEMSNLNNPLECGLSKYVSFTKGCYIGQEVIARLDAYDKISKHMVGLSVSEPITGIPGDVKITVDDKECGFVTSSVTSQKFGNIGLGFVKTIFLDYNKSYRIKHNNTLNDCKIIKLPFGVN